MNNENRTSNSSSAINEKKFNIAPDVKIGYVSLNVSDIHRSVEFYRSVLGFKLIYKASNDRALLSSEGNPSYLIELLFNRRKSSGPEEFATAVKMAGLYHFAILLPERKYLADMLVNLRANRDKVYFDGLADHLVSEAIYIRDPDFNGVEVYCDKPASEWKWSADNRLQMATLPLDTAGLLEEATEKGLKEMPARTRIGHVHFHIRTLLEAMKFYHEIMGLNLTTTYPGAYFFAADSYHHHIAVNTWLGSDIRRASSEYVGLNHFGIELPNKREYDKLVKRPVQYKVGMQQHNDELRDSKAIFLHDNDGITIRLYYA